MIFRQIPRTQRPAIIPEQEVLTIDARDLTHVLTLAALEKKAIDPVILDVTALASYADYFIICSGNSTRQVQAIAEWVEHAARQAGNHAMSVEGQSSGKWILMDFGSILLHIFYEPVRAFYDLEGLWADAPRLSLPLAEPWKNAMVGS